jgi:phosphatidylglycerol---prolipoprotein diacylglyceryl transferase
VIERGLTAAAALGHDTGPALFWSGALVAGVAYAVRSARRSALDPREAYWAATLAMLAGLFGSRVLGMVVYGSEGPFAWRQLVEGGRSYYGGLLAGTFAALVFLRLRGAPVLRYVDALAPATALGYCVGRLGCFFNGDDYGVPAHGFFAVRYLPHTEAYVAQLQRGTIAAGAPLAQPVLATQLVHAALGLALFLLLRMPRPEAGRRLGLFALGYGAGRFALEFLRGDFVASVGPLSLHQAISVGLIAAGALLLLHTKRDSPAMALAEAP